MKARFTPSAEADVRDVHEWYRRQHKDLASEFKRAVDVCVARIEENPLAYPRVHSDTRRALLRRFPYSIFYVVEPSELVVLGVFHGRRDPRVWRSRLET